MCWMMGRTFRTNQLRVTNLVSEYVVDIDVICVLDCGHIGWAKHTQSIRKVGSAHFDHKSDKAWLKTCSAAITTTAPLSLLVRVVLTRGTEAAPEAVVGGNEGAGGQ